VGIATEERTGEWEVGFDFEFFVELRFNWEEKGVLWAELKMGELGGGS